MMPHEPDLFTYVSKTFSSNQAISEVLVTGGAGYVGSVLVPKLLRQGYKVRVLDRYIYGDDVLSAVKGSPNLQQIRGDIRDQALLKRVLTGCDAD